jgi:upstream activation factor subunit UAF30
MATAKKGSGAKKAGAAKKGGASKAVAKKSAGKAGGKSAAKGGATKAAAKKPAAKKRAPNPAFMKPMTPSAQLAQVVGANPAPRTEITKKLWEYIKRKGLQDAKERRMINADENLRPIFKKDKVSMFDMTKLVNKHLSD